MSEITVTKEQVDELASKLDRLGEELSDEERALLLAIFALAGQAIATANEAEVAGFAMGSGLGPGSRVQVSGVQSTSVPLSDGFKSAFVRGPVGGVGNQQGIIAVILG